MWSRNFLSIVTARKIVLPDVGERIFNQVMRVSHFMKSVCLCVHLFVKAGKKFLIDRPKPRRGLPGSNCCQFLSYAKFRHTHTHTHAYTTTPIPSHTHIHRHPHSPPPHTHTHTHKGIPPNTHTYTDAYA